MEAAHSFNTDSKSNYSYHHHHPLSSSLSSPFPTAAFRASTGARSGSRSKSISTSKSSSTILFFQKRKQKRQQLNLNLSSSSQNENLEYDINSDNNTIEPYVGPITSIADMEGGIAISESALHVLVGPSLVSPGRGLFLSLYNDMDEEEDVDTDVDVNMITSDIVEEVVIPQGTPLCGYARGVFSSEESGDKSVGFLFSQDTPIFYEKQLMGIGDAIQLVQQSYEEEEEGEEKQSSSNNNKQLLWGHIVDIDETSGEMKSIRPDQDFATRIFTPDSDENENEFAATCLGMYANDLAYDPDITQKEKYIQKSNENNILQLIWRLAKDTQTGMLVPTWPVVVAKKDFRLCNTVPMEVGLQYGFEYWNSFKGHIN